jgi:hypothetical protein
MDYGDDPLMSTRYATEHGRAQKALQPGQYTLMAALKTRREWDKKSLAELRDLCVTPDMLVAARCTWGVLQRKHGAADLIEFGFRWPAMMAAGFDGSHLATLSLAQVSALGLTAHRMLECRPRIAHIAALGLTAAELHNQGWNEELLRAIGLDMVSMVAFGIPLHVWRDTVGVTGFQELGFTNYAECARMGWRVPDIELALAPARAAPGRPAVTPAAKGMRFI